MRAGLFTPARRLRLTLRITKKTRFGRAGGNASSNPFSAHLVPTLRVDTHWMAAPRPRNGTSTVSISYDNGDAERPSSSLRRWSVVTRAFNGLDEALPPEFGRLSSLPGIFRRFPANPRESPRRHAIAGSPHRPPRRPPRRGSGCGPCRAWGCEGTAPDAPAASVPADPSIRCRRPARRRAGSRASV